MRGHVRMKKHALGGIVALTMLALSTSSGVAMTYTTGDVVYVAYKQSGAEYIVNIGTKDDLLNATTTISFSRVNATDVNTLLGATGANIYVSVFAIKNVTTRDGILTP